MDSLSSDSTEAIYVQRHIISLRRKFNRDQVLAPRPQANLIGSDGAVRILSVASLGRFHPWRGYA